jgi:predicted RNA-binding Zn-ribbon protein involved in translation (DUF1610 family)
MNVPASVYCSRCQEPVKPIKCIVIYRCPACGAPFVGYTEHAEGLEHPKGEEVDQPEGDHAGQEFAVA